MGNLVEVSTMAKAVCKARDFEQIWIDLWMDSWDLSLRGKWQGKVLKVPIYLDYLHVIHKFDKAHTFVLELYCFIVREEEDERGAILKSFAKTYICLNPSLTI
ncbi:hypothetical protein V6N11_031789 [Hibiscus sabdariffa]|uniref:Uncharacterized protein n=1 Tax=Hibiscus sabdariffa TaxID=183260 RepID=A0ABR2SZ01_9ROSI